ncbi:hypothetical protein [Streptacidiphilus sp. EB103A]|uniref:hypothetical protein n=1 Tax=Streptacidiphilus sp. EB103A TaxID=3156275 RepID=UPI00351374C9
MELEPDRPPIPRRCQNLSRAGGLAVPYITPHSRVPLVPGLPDTTHATTAVFGAVDNRRRKIVLRQGRCQVCAQRLEDTAVFLVRPQDRLHGWTPEPAVHPEGCFPYSHAACPMLDGRMPRHRRSPLSLRHLAADGQAPPAWERAEVGGYEPGHAAYAWDAWWVPREQYRLRYSDDGSLLLGLDLRDVVPDRVEHLRDAEGEDPIANGYRFLDAARALFNATGTSLAPHPAPHPTEETGTCPVRTEQ